MHLRENELVRLQSPVSFHTASRSQRCTMPLFVAMVEKHPETYNLTEPTQNASHVMLLETSDEAAREVLEALMEPFCTTDTSASNDQRYRISEDMSSGVDKMSKFMRDGIYPMSAASD
ncbi:hypothetical protein Gpo141_00001363 [Globisporangium polare]